MKLTRPCSGPGPLALARAVLQIQHGVAPLRLAVVVGRRIDEGPAGLGRDLRMVPQGTDFPVRHVLAGIEVELRVGHFQAAGLLPPTEEGLARRVVDAEPIDDQLVIVKAGTHGRGGHRPHAGSVLLHLEGAVAEPIVVAARSESDLAGVRGFQAEGHAQIVVDLGKLATGHVARCGLAVGGECWRDGAGEDQQGENSRSDPVHGRTLPFQQST